HPDDSLTIEMGEQQNFIVLNSRYIVENVYGGPSSRIGTKGIEAFLKKAVERPAPAKGAEPPAKERAYRVDVSGYEAVNKPRDINGRIAFRAVRGKKEFVV